MLIHISFLHVGLLFGIVVNPYVDGIPRMDNSHNYQTLRNTIIARTPRLLLLLLLKAESTESQPALTMTLTTTTMPATTTIPAITTAKAVRQMKC